MDRLPNEILFCIATHLDSPKDLCAFSFVSKTFNAVALDDRLWKNFCRRLYHISPPTESMAIAYYHLFTKMLAPYGRYLGYWKSNERFIGGLIHIELNLSDQMIVASRVNAINERSIPINFFFDFDSDEEDDGVTEENSILKPLLISTPLFSIDLESKLIKCSLCDKPHVDLPWITTHPIDQPHWGLSQEILPENQRADVLTRDAMDIEQHQGSDVYFLLHCSNESSITYRPLSIPRAIRNEGDHPFNRLNGIWIGSYGGHGLEILYVYYQSNFSYSIIEENEDEPIMETSPHALVARKITGDPNVPHGQISFAATRSVTDGVFDGIGQIAHHGFVDHRFIRTRVKILSDRFLKVTWFALHHTSSFKRYDL